MTEKILKPFPSHTKIGEIIPRLFEPINPKCYVLIIHGMAEHSKRYDDFANFLVKHNIGVILFDLPGHGDSINTMDQLGSFGEDGEIQVIRDIDTMVDMVKNAINPDIPLVMMGHSMGSMLARIYCAVHGDKIQKAIFCGTMGSNPMVKPSIFLCNYLIAKKGIYHRSKAVADILNNNNLKGFKSPRTPFDWLSRNENEVDKYIDDEKCGFMFDLGAYKSLFRWMEAINTTKWAKKVPNIPILIIGGGKDTVGNNGKGLVEVEKNLLSTHHNHVTTIIYPEYRHEILNEIDKQKVYNDIKDWIIS